MGIRRPRSTTAKTVRASERGIAGRFHVLDKFQQGIFALTSNNNVDEWGFERLLGSSELCQPRE